MARRKWKLLTGILMAAMMLTLAACSGSPAASGPGDTGAKPGGTTADSGKSVDRVKLEYWTKAPQEEIDKLKDLIFKDVMKEVDINFVTVPGAEYENKLRIAINGGKAPDIFEVDGVYTSNYAHNGALLALDPYWDPKDFQDYVNSSQEKTMYNGKRYAASLHETSVVVFYNKDHFAKAGITAVPTKFSEAWTWQQYLDAAKKLTQSEGGKTTVYGAIPGWKAPDNASEAAVFTHLLFIWNNGGLVTDEKLSTAKGYLDSDKTIKALQFYQDFFQKDKVAPLESITKSLEGFEVGKLSMFLGNVSNANTLKKNFPDINFGVMPVPVGEQKYATSGGWNIGISSQTKHPKEAWKVVDALTGKEGHLKYSEFKGFIPSRKSTLESMKSLNEPPLSVSKEMMPYAKARPITPAYAEISPIIGEMMNAIAYGKDVKTEATNAANNIDKVLKKYAK